MVDDPNHHQTWSPPLLNIENFTKKFNKKIWKNYTLMITFMNYGCSTQPLSNMAANVTKNRKFDKKSSRENR